jgi:membrane associated rhomboid family serine protease
VVLTLIVVNVAVFIWEQTKYANVVGRFGIWPVAVHHGQWYRLFTAPFLHANISHILFNMLTLAIIGSPVEAELGRVRFGALYVVSALGGSVGSYLLSNPNQLGVGASGAIFGLMGAYFVLARRRGWEFGNILGLIVLNLVIGFASTAIDWRAHLGGLITGAVVSLGLARSAELRRVASRTVEVAAGAATTAAAAVVLGGLALLPPGHVNL